MSDLYTQIDLLKKERDEARAALRTVLPALREALGTHGSLCHEACEVRDNLRAAIRVAETAAPLL